MWLLLFFCMSPGGSVPISLNISAAGYTAYLNHTLNATSSAPVGTLPLNDAIFVDYTTLNLTLNATSSAPVGATPLNDAPNATRLAAVSDYVASLNRTLNATNSAPVGTNPLNDAPNATRLNADYATNQTLNATSLAEVGTTPLNDSSNATSLAADYTVSLSLNATSHNANGSASGAAAPELDSSGNERAETMDELDQDMPVKEGDILMQEDRNAVQTLWPDATVPYIISDELAYREAEIKAAVKMISDVTCIRFKKRDTESNYVKFIGGSGCASFVGCLGGAQKLFVAPVCNVGNLCHELIHALGLHHEHTREDRDKYITVNWLNIVPGKEENFKVKYGNTQSLPYDPDSIMHYGQGFFSANGNPTMVPKESGVTIGQRTHLSQLDIQRLNKLYHCA